MLSHVVSKDAIVMFRAYLSSLSLMALRSTMLKLLEFITDLDMVPSHFLEAETPSLSLLQAAVVDLVKSYSRRRSGNSLVLFYKEFSLLKLSHSDSDSLVVFLDDSFVTWFDSTKALVSNALVIFSRNFADYSVKHVDFETITSMVDRCFLPQIELEVAFAQYLTFDEPCTAENP